MKASTNSCTPGLADRLELDGISHANQESHNEPRRQPHSRLWRPGLHRLPAPLRDARRPVSGAGASRARKSSFTARHPVPIVDEALLALQQLGWPKGPRHVQHIYIGQSDRREAVTLADCWSHQPGRRSTMPAPASALSRSAGLRLVHRSAPAPPAELGV